VFLEGRHISPIHTSYISHSLPVASVYVLNRESTSALINSNYAARFCCQMTNKMFGLDIAKIDTIYSEKEMASTFG
jgi:hypothetical protein